MNFYRYRHNILLIVCFMFVLGKGDTQIIFSPHDSVEANTSMNINDYYNIYPEVPTEPIVEINWYKSPEDISRRVELNNIAHSTRYLDDGNPYLEKIVYGLKSRLFLKEVKGYRYTIYDLKYVPYQDDPELIARDKEEETQQKIEKEKKKAEEQQAKLTQDVENITDNTTALAVAQDAAPVVSEENPDLEEEMGEIIRTTSQQDYEKKLLEPITPLKDDNPLRNSLVPGVKERNRGVSLYVDVVIQSVSNISKRERLYRYAGKGEKIYFETYNYTDKGALQRLNREFENGATQRYTYYFSTGGLKDVFYQDPDGSIYLLSYTISGNLLSKVLYNTRKQLSYELHNTYDDKDALTSQVETDYENRQEIHAVFKDSYVSEKKFYTLKFEGDIEEEKEESKKKDEKEKDSELSADNNIEQKETVSETDADDKDNTKVLQESSADENTKVLQESSKDENTKVLQESSEDENTKASQESSKDENTKVFQESSKDENTKVLQESSEDENTKASQESSKDENTKVFQESSEDENTKVLQESSEDENTKIKQESDTPETRTITERIFLKTENFEYSPAGEQVKFEERNILHEDIMRVEKKDGETKVIKSRDGNIISEIIQRGKKKIHIYYFKGEPILRVYYDGKKQLKEEVINNGEVIETRQGH